MFGFGAGELIVVGVILFLLFGAKRLPDIGKGLGGAIREFRKVKKDLSLDEETDAHQGRTGAQQEKPKPALEAKAPGKVTGQAPGSEKAE